MLISYRVAYGKDRPVPSSKRVAPCRIFHVETGQLIVGVGQPIPDDLPDSVLRYEDPAMQPEPVSEPVGETDPAPEPVSEPEPKTAKRRGTRTRVRPPAENRTATTSRPATDTADTGTGGS